MLKSKDFIELHSLILIGHIDNRFHRDYRSENSNTPRFQTPKYQTYFQHPIVQVIKGRLCFFWETSPVLDSHPSSWTHTIFHPHRNKVIMHSGQGEPNPNPTRLNHFSISNGCAASGVDHFWSGVG